MEAFKNVDEKDFYSRLMLVSTSIGYASGLESIEKCLEKLDNNFKPEKKIKGFPKRVNYFGEKIRIASELLGMKKIYEEKKIEDILTITKYIATQLEKITKEVME